jgi:flagellar FliL protein
MADDDDLDDDLQEGAAGGGKKKLIIIGAAALVLLLAVGGGAYWFMLMSSDSEPQLAEDGTEITSEEEYNPDDSKALYHKLKPKFTTTFEANSRQRYMQVEITLVTRDEEVVPHLVTHQPLIRNALVLLLASQDYLQLQTMEGKAELRIDANSAVQDILKREIGKPGIERVLFTDFVMQ